jgi:predicted ATPase
VGRLQDASVRLLTLVGPGGTGKTTLSIRAAEDVSVGFPDGVCFVDLSSARDTNTVLVAIARATGLDEVIDHTLQEELAKVLGDRQALLLLDNFEQVAEAAGSVAKLLSDCPRLKVLVTSREALHVRAEQVYPVSPLTLPPAGVKRASAKGVESCESAQLFVDRAQASRPGSRLTDDNAPAVAEICRRLDGLPLAIELAAARLGLFSPEALRDQLQNRLGLLRSGPRDLPQRQQTLRSTLDWSYELLKPGEQRLFELLAVFADAEITAVEAVAARSDASEGGAGDVLDELGRLIDKSLIRRLEQPQGESRITMLETIREFAADRLEQQPDFSARARRAHAAYYARGWYLDTVVLTTDMLSVLKTHASSPERVGQEIALRTSLARALMATKGFTPEVENAFASAIELFERGTDARQQFSVLRGLARLYELRGQVDKAAHLAREILAPVTVDQHREVVLTLGKPSTGQVDTPKSGHGRTVHGCGGQGRPGAKSAS